MFAVLVLTIGYMWIVAGAYGLATLVVAEFSSDAYLSIWHYVIRSLAVLIGIGLVLLGGRMKRRRTSTPRP